ncbi:MAG TPA: ribonuclease III domain-containing protein [Candidatus Saccharimonadales bacterium]|nr:ribonuclease III domain-containing protein [Candidatus Saccharimonadales bacterium]
MSFKIKTNRQNLIPSSNLKDLIINLLTPIVTNVNDYITPDKMVLWTRAFTSEIFDPTYNYEENEYVGDRVLKFVYPKYLKKRDPSYTRKDITNIDMSVMEKKTQSDLAFELGLVDFILIPHHGAQVPIGVRGDVFESFMGALFNITNQIIPGLGLFTCYNMNVFIFNQNQIPEELRKGNAKMLVEQIFKQLAQPMVIVDEKKIANKFDIQIKLNKTSIDFFNTNHINLPFIIGKAEGNTKNTVIKTAYEKALKTLEENGVDEEFIKLIKQNKKKEFFISERDTASQLISFDIKTVVVDILSLFIKNEQMLNQFVSDDNMTIWKNVFEQKVDDDLFYFGEIAIKGLLAIHLWQIYQHDQYNKEDFNNIMSHISKNLSLFLTEPPLSYLDNHLEAFIGAVDKISDDIYFGLSMIHDYQLIQHIFTKELIPYDFRYKHPKTALEQLLSPFLGRDDAKPNLNVSYDETTKTHTFEITLTDKQLQWINQHGFKNLVPLLAYHTGTGSKKKIQKEAYQMALKTLEELGITKYWADQLKQKIEFKSFKLLPFYDELEKKRQKDGYDYLYFAAPIKTTTLTETTIQLVGVVVNKKTILSSILVEPSVDKMDAKVLLIKDYIYGL